MRKAYILLSLLMFFVMTGQAKSYQKTNLGIKTQINTTDVEIQFYNSSTVRIIKSPVGENVKKESLSVIKKPQTAKFTVNQQGDIIFLKSDKIRVDIDTKSGKINHREVASQSLLLLHPMCQVWGEQSRYSM